VIATTPAPARLGHHRTMDGIQLRFRTRETACAPPDIAAFTGVDRTLMDEQHADTDDRSPLDELVTAGVIAKELHVVADPAEPRMAEPPVFVTLRTTPIPAIAIAPQPADADAFVLPDELHGHLAWPTITTRRPRPLRGAALVFTVCIPLILPDMALAARPGPTAVVAAQSPRPVALPLKIARRGAPPAPAATPSPPPPPAPAEATPSTDAPAPPPAVPPALEQALQAMKGTRVLVHAGGSIVDGRLVGVDGDLVTLQNVDDGRIAMIPKVHITHVYPKVDRPKDESNDDDDDDDDDDDELPTGIGLTAAGGILTGVGTAGLITGIALFAITPSSYSVYLPAIIPATLLLGAGIPMLAIGVKRRRAYNEACSKPRRRLEPAVSRTRHGTWTGGLTLRF
jgi:hypothetical protein